jgi:hypothetical protein
MANPRVPPHLIDSKGNKRKELPGQPEDETHHDRITALRDPAQIIGAMLPYRDLAACSCVSRGAHHLFAAPLLKHRATELLKHFIYANWAAAKELITMSPELMFQTVTGTEINGRKIEIRPLEYAAYANYFSAVLLCKNALKTAEQTEHFFRIIQPYLPAAFEPEANARKQMFFDYVNLWLSGDADVTIEHLREFLREQTILLSAQQNSYSLQPFYWAYEAFLMLYDRRWNLHDRTVTDEMADMFWDNLVGFVQRSLLTREKLMRMCMRERNDGSYCWSTEANFTEAEPAAPEECSVNCEYPGNINLYLTNFPDLYQSEDYALHRDNGESACWLLTLSQWSIRIETIADSLAIFRRLDAMSRQHIRHLCEIDVQPAHRASLDN